MNPPRLEIPQEVTVADLAGALAVSGQPLCEPGCDLLGALAGTELSDRKDAQLTEHCESMLCMMASLTAHIVASCMSAPLQGEQPGAAAARGLRHTLEALRLPTANVPRELHLPLDSPA